MKILLAFTAVVLCLSLTAMVSAQRNITTFGTPITENFNTFGTGNVNVTDNTTIQGFYTFRTLSNATPNPCIADNGSASTIQFYNFGSVASADRAAGAVAGPATGTIYYGLRFANTTGNTIGSITVTYTGEQWRDGTSSAETMFFSYQVGSTVTSLTTGTWTPVTALNFITPTNPSGSGPLDGNAAANRATLSATFAVNIPAGQEIMLRWADIDDTGLDAGVAIDDVSFTAVAPTAAPASISGRVVSAYGRGISRALVTVTDLYGESRSYFTNTMGYYSATGLSAGQSYVVSVSAKGYTFPNSSQLVDLSDSVSGLDFIAR